MLTPQEITDKVFIKAVFGGYDMTGVDDFLEELSADYSALYKENAILKSKLKVLVEKVEEYRSTEDAMRMALLTAQRMGEEITLDANKKKEELLRDADSEARNRLAGIARQISDEEARLAAAAAQTEKFIGLSHAIMGKHSEFLTKLETARRAVRPEPEPAPPPPQQYTQPAYEAQISETAEQIGNAVERLTSTDTRSAGYPPVREQVPEGETQYAPQYDDEGEPTKLYPAGNPEDPVTPRPKFDFDDLKFGSNFDSK